MTLVDHLTFRVSDYLPAKYVTGLLWILIKNMHVINFKCIDLYWDFLMTRVKKPPVSVGDTGSIPRLRRSPGEENGNPLQHSCLRNPMDRAAWQATVQGVAMIWTLLSDWIATQIEHYHSKRLPLAMHWYWILEMQLIWIEIIYKYKTYAGFYRLGTEILKNEGQWLKDFICWLLIEMMIF